MYQAYKAHEKEVHLFIIWSNGMHYKEEIIESIRNRFLINKVVTILWSQELFGANLRRFYGQNLPKNSNKERECGNGPLTAIIATDKNPLYAPRKTTSGVHVVNINTFDIKEQFRRKTGTNILHATNNVEEAEHDITLLFGKAPEDLAKQEFESIPDELYEDIVGARGWESIQQMLYVLNHTCKYVVLRNFENYPESVELGAHSDMDILCENLSVAQKILNASPTKKMPWRVQQKVQIDRNFIHVDLRYVGDNYYDKEWQKEILRTRVLNEKGFYTPNMEEYLYSLVYHALIQKHDVSEDYVVRIKELCNKIHVESIDMDKLEDAIGILNEYMKDKSYHYIEPKDYSVGFYYRRVNAKAGIYRRFRFLLSDIKHLIIR